MGETNGVLRVVQIQAVHEAQALVPVKSHFLQRNIRPGRVTQRTAEIIARTPYAAAVEFGSKPHIIRPRFKKVLAWGGQRRLTGRLSSGSRPTHFAKLVHHPGTRAQPYLIPGAKRAIQQVRDALVDRWNRAA